MKLPSLCAVLLLAMSVLPLSSVARGTAEPSRQGNERSPSINQAAQWVARDLTAQGYEVERGYPMLWTEDDCDRYTSPILQFCGNDPDSPYVILAVKSWPDEFVDPATVNAFGRTRRGYSATYRLDPREAIIVLGELPPPGRYTGLQTWVFTTEWLTEDTPWNTSAPVFKAVQALAPELLVYLFGTVPQNSSRVLSFSSVSNVINNVVIQRQSGTAFGQTRYFIITPDQAMDRAVRSSLGLAGVPDENMFTEPIPLRDEVGEIGPLGLDAKANDFTTWIRYKSPDNEHAAHAWWANLPLTVLRVRERPSSDRPAEPFPPFVADERTAAPEDVYADDLDNLAWQVCLRWGQPCGPDRPASDQLRQLIDLQLTLGDFGPQCRAIGMDCLGDTQDSSYFIAPARVLDPGWVYAVVGTLGTATGNATYVGLSVNDMSKLKGVLSVNDTALAGSAASYAGTVNNTNKFFVHYLARDCGAIQGLTDGQCSTITEDMVPPLGESPQGLFSAIVRSYVRPGTARGPLSSEQLNPMVIRFAQP
jgi:hypothetical protein